MSFLAGFTEQLSHTAPSPSPRRIFEYVLNVHDTAGNQLAPKLGICVLVSVPVRMSVCWRVCVCACPHAYAPVCVGTRMCVVARVCTCACVCVLACVCACVCWDRVGRETWRTGRVSHVPKHRLCLRSDVDPAPRDWRALLVISYTRIPFHPLQTEHKNISSGHLSPRGRPFAFTGNTAFKEK